MRTLQYCWVSGTACILRGIISLIRPHATNFCVRVRVVYFPRDEAKKSCVLKKSYVLSQNRGFGPPQAAAEKIALVTLERSVEIASVIHVSLSTKYVML